MIKTTKLLTILTVLALLTVFCSCAGNGEETEGCNVSNEPLEPEKPQATFPELGWETELRIKKDYLADLSIEPSELYIDRVKIKGYFGKYNGIILVYIESDLVFLLGGGLYNGFNIFGYNFDRNIGVWLEEDSHVDNYMKFYGTNHHFAALWEAYFLGFVTMEDIEIMHYRYYNDPTSWNPPRWNQSK